MSMWKPWFRVPAASRAVVLLVAASWFAVVACTDGRVSPDAVATSDLGEVTQSDLDDFILTLEESERKPAEGQELAEWRKEKIVQLLVTRYLEEEARRRGIAESEEAARLLAAQVDDLLAQEVEARVIRDRVRVGDADLEAFYAENPEEFRRGEQVRVRHIFRRVERGASAAERQAVRAEIESLLRQLRDGANFEELAKAHSQSETAATGGLIGRISRGTFPPDQEQIIWALAEGEISDVVETPVGFHVFRVDDHLAPEEKELDMVRGLVTRRLTNEKTTQVLAEYFAELLGASQARYAPQGLASADEATLLFELQDESLTLGEWRELMRGKSFFTQREKSVKDLFDDWVRRRLYLWEARRSGLAEEPAVAEKIAELSRSIGMSLVFRDRQAAIVDAIPDRELREYYEAQALRFQTPRLYHLRLLAASPIEERGEGLYTVYERLDRVADVIRKGDMTFDAAARRWSEDPSAIVGGDVGAIRLDAFAEWAGPAAQNAVMALRPGEISEPLLIERYDRRNLNYTREGYMLVELVEIREPEPLPFDDVRDEVVEQIAAQREVEILDKMADDVLSEIHARIYEGTP